MSGPLKKKIAQESQRGSKIDWSKILKLTLNSLSSFSIKWTGRLSKRPSVASRIRSPSSTRNDVVAAASGLKSHYLAFFYSFHFLRKPIPVA